jgi:minor extracellular protease Epr
MKNAKKKLSAALAAAMILSGVPSLSAYANDSQTTSTKEGEYVVVFKDKLDDKDMKKEIENYSGQPVDEFEKLQVSTAKLTEKEAKNLAKDPDVATVEKNTKFKMLGTVIPQYSHDKTNVKPAWKQGLTGKGVKIAVLDSGVAPHSDLNIAGGVSTVDYTNSYNDDNGHGTHVAGVIASKNNGIGTTGVAPGASVYAVKVLNRLGEGSLVDIIEGLDWAIQHKVDIINLSLGTPDDSAALKAAVDKAYQQGILVVAAAGNSGNSTGSGDTMMYPAKYDSVISVGATDQSNKRASFSSTGPTLEIVAPGQSIASTYLNNGYAIGSGTSQAAPYVSGILALMKEKYPTKTNVELRQMLQHNALDLGVAGRDSLYGFGLVQFPNEVAQKVTQKPVTEPVTTKTTTTPTQPTTETQQVNATIPALDATIQVNKDVFHYGDVIRVKAKVVNHLGKPVSNAKVYFEAVRFDGYVQKERVAYTNSNGECEFAFLANNRFPEGVYNMVIRAQYLNYKNDEDFKSVYIGR